LDEIEGGDFEYEQHLATYTYVLYEYSKVQETSLQIINQRKKSKLFF